MYSSAGWSLLEVVVKTRSETEAETEAAGRRQQHTHYTAQQLTHNEQHAQKLEQMDKPCDDAFRAIRPNYSCFFIWRVEKMKLVSVARDHYGNFFNGDSYIILSMKEAGEVGGTQLVPKESQRPLEMSIHFWLGESTTNDEAGVAAYKTVELDNWLGGAPVQYREVQSYESKKFIAYFKNGIRVLQGGAASGFHHVTHQVQERMFLVKGKRTPLVLQLASVGWQHVNDGDVYILDLEDAIFVWTGKAANRMEKLTGARVAQNLKDERSRPIVIVADGEEEQMTAAEKQRFNRMLPLEKKRVTSAVDAAADDAKAERKSRSQLKLHRCREEAGRLQVEEVKSGPLQQQDLNSQDSFIVDNGADGIWVWVGKTASPKERQEAMKNAQEFCKSRGYGRGVAVTRVIDGGEPVEFKALFRAWSERDAAVGLGRVHRRENIAKVDQTTFDAAILHQNHQMAADTQMVDDGSGSKQVYRMEQSQAVTVDPQHHGLFHDGDCYVIFYTYRLGGSERYIVYYWLGSKSSSQEQGAAALKAVELDAQVGDRAVQVRVTQSKEPAHLVAIFGGKFIIYHGHRGQHDEAHMLQVRAAAFSQVKAWQVALAAASLNSNDAFFLRTPTSSFVWTGKGSSQQEQEMAKAIAQFISKGAEVITEGAEPAAFWEALGGRGVYSSERHLQEERTEHPPRLFQCSNASGRFKVDEIVDFNQSDLIEDDVMLLDIGDQLFIWIGQQSNPLERQLAQQTAIEYLQNDPSQRDPATPIVNIKQGHEPPNFTGFFGVWDRSFWEKNKTFEQMKSELSAKTAKLSLA